MGEIVKDLLGILDEIEEQGLDNKLLPIKRMYLNNILEREQHTKYDYQLVVNIINYIEDTYKEDLTNFKELLEYVIEKD